MGNYCDAEIARLHKRPEVTLGEDGYILIDWHVDPSNTFSLSIGPNGEVACSGISEINGDTWCSEITPEVFRAISQFIEEETNA